MVLASSSIKTTLSSRQGLNGCGSWAFVRSETAILISRCICLSNVGSPKYQLADTTLRSLRFSLSRVRGNLYWYQTHGLLESASPLAGAVAVCLSISLQSDIMQVWRWQRVPTIDWNYILSCVSTDFLFIHWSWVCLHVNDCQSVHFRRGFECFDANARVCGPFEHWHGFSRPFSKRSFTQIWEKLRSVVDYRTTGWAMAVKTASPLRAGLWVGDCVARLTRVRR